MTANDLTASDITASDFTADGTAGPSVLWFRRDLRTEAHPALAAAAAASGDAGVVALFVDDPALRRSAGAPRLAFLHDCLAALDASTGGHLVVRRGDPADVVASVAAEVGAHLVVVTRDHGPYGRRRDERVVGALSASDRRLRGVASNYAVTPGTVMKDDGTPYSVFTPFFRRWRQVLDVSGLGGVGDVGDPEAVPWMELATEGLPERPDPGCVLPAAGTSAALDRWHEFLDDGLDRYHELRNRPDVGSTSRLSPHLKWGTVHPSMLLADLRDRGGPDPDAHRVFTSELAWRDFYADVLFHQPRTAWENLNPKMDAMAVDTDAAARERFDRWREGRTGFPLVDAGMRQLRRTGWMHNRLRMVTASFLVKDLHLPWQWGAQHFMDLLVDGDLASNSHGWQWTAGTGTDPAPYFRVFNPAAQADRYDPDGEYVARWIPELGTDDYPAPIVDHAAERIEALARHGALDRS